jgi:hypothetical protein
MQLTSFLDFSLRAVNGWAIFCAFDASRFMKANTSYVAVPLAINALRNLTFWI